MMLSRIFLVMSLVVSIAPKEVCYKEINECFSDDKPYGGTLERLIPLPLPESPQKINAQFRLYTKENPDTYQVINDSASINASNFRTDRKTKMVIHGYNDYGDDTWVIDMCKATLQVQDVNFISVDWREGAKSPYTQAASNVRVLGAVIALFLKTLKDIFGYLPFNIHIIAHSLGAHGAGETGKRILIFRITGMDPAQPLFQGTPPEVRLDLSDAKLVDVIHTDTRSFVLHLGLGGYGINQNIGHIDFQPNGGKKMPGCSEIDFIKDLDITKLYDIDYIYNVTYALASCSHTRSIYYYIQSILIPDGFLGYFAVSYDAFQQGAGFPCPDIGCPMMGHNADQYRGITAFTQTFYLNTGGDLNELPRWRHKVTLNTTGSLALFVSFNVSLEGSNGTTRYYTIYSGIPNRSNTKFIDVEKNVGPIISVTFIWKGTGIGIERFGASAVTVQSGKDRAIYSFCGSGTVPKETPQVLGPC